jgi:hypothetical protein
MSALKILNNSSDWSDSYLVDRLKQHLAIVECSINDEYYKDGNPKVQLLFGPRKYYNRALNYLKVGGFNPVPSFIINLSDLTPKLIKELHELDKYDRRLVLKQVVGRVFEDIDFELYHNSISKVLEVELQP